MLQLIVDWCVYSVFRFTPDSRLAGVINFFIYDSLKILLLLFVMISVIGTLRTFLPQNKVRKWLAAKKGLGNLFASMFGAVTPFCSCSSIPIFLSFLEAGVPLGVTFSFLITSPLINEYLVVLMIGFFGWKITGAYVLSGIIIGVSCGIILGKLKLERYLVKDLISAGPRSLLREIEYQGIRERVSFGIKEAKSIVAKLWVWILVGVGVGALIHNYIPQAFIQALISKTGIFSVPIATAMGVPMYGSCAAIVPVAVVLFQKGIPLGTALSFMMATAALS
ncbi:MAG: permease, partial [Candidatus Omnitrophota bacterium]|nr:permease [Candidatus Omnitrophota bacterium]